MLPENEVIQHLRTIADAKKIFLVGGPVRDHLLGRESKDCDLMVEGDALSLARQLADHFGCGLTVNEQLLTAALHTGWGTVDLAAARREIYEYPGALPQVYPATWREDLQRRDFTVNTLALPLRKKGWGEVVNILDGIDDLHNRQIRALHEKSFQDDPTRLLRAVRLKNRLGFHFEEKTSVWLRRDWDYLRLVSPARRLKEWQLLCAEKEPGAILDDIFCLGGWEVFMGGIPYQSALVRKLDHTPLPREGRGFRVWFFCLVSLLGQSAHILPEISAYWGLPQKDSAGIAAVLRVYAETDKIGALPRRCVYRQMQDLPVEGVYYLFREILSNGDGEWDGFYSEVQSARMPLSGRDLLALGFERGPALGRLLRRLEESYEKGDFDQREEGLIIAQRIAKEDM